MWFFSNNGDIIMRFPQLFMIGDDILYNKNYYSPPEIGLRTIETCINKVNISSINQLLLGFLAGAFIAFAAEGSNMAAFNLLVKPETYGLGKSLAGCVFGTGLMMVLIAGGELFTGNTLIFFSVLEGKIKLTKMLKNWFFVYIGNFIGSVFIAYMIAKSGLLNSGLNTLGALTIKIASYKVELPFISAFYLGIMCNWLVCLAVWMSYAAKDITGKIAAVFFPIWLFVTSGFEHSIANMYYVPAGIFAKTNIDWVEASHISSEQLTNLNWDKFLINNLIPVTLGNIVGGLIFVSGIYWFIYSKKEKLEEERRKVSA